MREHDKTIVNRLEPHTPGVDPLRRVSLRPIAELSLPTPRTATFDRRPPLSAPLLPPPQFRRPTIAEETRHMLLFEHGAEKRASPEISERRQSAPPGELLARHLALQRQREHMRRRGPMAMLAVREADLFVIPVEHRRLSTVGLPSMEGSLPTPCPQDGHVTIRVVVHSPGRRASVLTRNFDLDELRATIPEPSPLPHAHASRRASLAVFQAPLGDRRSASPAFASERRHSSGAIRQANPARLSAAERRNCRRESAAVPIRELPYTSSSDLR